MSLNTQSPWKSEFRHIVQTHFKNLKSKNARFSIRAFSRKIELSHGCTWDIVSGEQNWEITQERAVKILKKLNLSGEDQIKCNRLLVSMGASPDRQSEFMQESMQELLLTWAADLILMQYDLNKDSRPSYEDLASRFGLKKELVEQLVQKFENSDLLKRNTENELYRERNFYETPTEIPNMSGRQYLKQNLRLSEQALDKIEPAKRHFAAVTFAGDSEKMKELVEKIEKLINEADLVMGTEKNNQVYRLSIGLFPTNFNVDTSSL